MALRMAEYYIMLVRKYQLPVKQYVVFLKDTHPVMQTVFKTEELQFKFNMIRIVDIDYKVFLESENPETKMLGILANFNHDDNETAINAIIEGIRSKTKGDFAESRYFKQLRIFVQLRNDIKHKFNKAMESVSTFFKEENDYFYQKGELKGEIKGEIKGKAQALFTVVKNLIKEPGISDEWAARIAEVTVEYVKAVRAQIK